MPVDEQLDDGLAALADELLLLPGAGDERDPADGVHVHTVRQLLQGAVTRLACGSQRGVIRQGSVTGREGWLGQGLCDVREQ